MKVEYIIGLILLVSLGIGGIVIFTSESKMDAKPTGISLSPKGVEPETSFVEIANPSGFVNTNDVPIKIADYVGKQVILLDIMTYSCINCQRTFPYITAWYERYKDDGLIVIGIHTPEFAFEKDKKNVEEAMKKFGITFPVVLDNDYGTWNALGNKYWPHKYLIDIHGNVVYDHVGEGGYEETEMKIKELLAERATVLGATAPSDDVLTTQGIAETKVETRSPETYFGSLRNDLLANGKNHSLGEQTFSSPAQLAFNKLYLGGVWNVSEESAVALKESTVHYRYSAKEVYIVAESEKEGFMTVLQDGIAVDAAAGEDVEAGTVRVKNSRLYKLIKNDKSGEHTLELKVSPGVKLFAFTFG